MMTPTLIESISSASSVFPSPLDAALAYARRAWPVLPLHPVQEGRCGCRRSCTHPGKHPIGTLVPQGFKNATTNDETIRE